MDLKPLMLERAFDLARSGAYTRLEDIRLQLKREGYAEFQLYGASLRKQLRALIVEARKTSAESADQAESAQRDTPG
jgi:hypothetical protein